MRCRIRCWFAATGSGARRQRAPLPVAANHCLNRSESARQSACRMNDRDNVYLLLHNAIEDAIRIFKKLAQSLLIGFRNHCTQVRLIRQLFASCEDALDQVQSVARGTPPDEGFDGVQIG